MAWLPILVLTVFGMVSIAFMMQMPKEKRMHNIKRVIRGNPEADVVFVPEPEPVVEPEPVEVVEPEVEYIPVVEPEPEHVVDTIANSDICIVTAFKPPTQKEFFSYDTYKKIIPLATSNIWDYAKHHGYKVYLFNEDSFDTSKKSSWVKIRLFRKYLGKCSWVMYTDIDWLFTSNKELPIDEKYDMIVSNECIKGNSWKKMSGTMIMKNSDWSRNFLNRWDQQYTKYKNVVNHDQTAFEDMLRKTPNEVKLLPPKQFMTYDSHNCVPPGFGIHFPAGNKHNRVPNAMNKYNIGYSQNTFVNISGTNVIYQVPYKMASADIIIGVLSYDKSKRSSMRILYADESMYFIVGKKNGAFDYDEFYTHNDMILIDMEESYDGENSILPLKTQVFLHAVNTHILDFDYALKIDDDSFVKMERLRTELKLRKPDYWGHVWYKNIINRNPSSKWYVSRKTFPEKVYPDYCSGAGYVLSKELVSCVDTKIASHKFMPREDVATGILAKACGSAPQHSDKVQHMKPYKSDDFIIRHYVDIKNIKSQPKITKREGVIRVSPDDGHHYMYGYYDKRQVDVSNDRILLLQIPFYNREPSEEDEVNVGWVDDSRVFHKITVTSAWNLQQGSMLEWVDNNMVVFNIRKNQGFQAVVYKTLDFKSWTLVKSYNRPVYAWDYTNGRFASISFARLHNLRRGYGYTVPLVELEKCPDNDGIWIVGDQEQLLFSYNELKSFLQNTGKVDKYTGLEHKDRVPTTAKYWWVNHLMWSSDGKFLSFITRASNEIHGHSYQFSTLMMADVENRKLWRVPTLRGSHPFHHKSLLNCEDKGSYSIVFQKSVTQLTWQKGVDGHCSRHPQYDIYLTDTYPRPKKSLLVFESNKKQNLGAFLPGNEGPIFTRCDLHPRWSTNGDFILFDSTHKDRKRAIYKVFPQIQTKNEKKCKHILIDWGANIGMHSRFVYESDKYKASRGSNLEKMYAIFNEKLGNLDQRRQYTCVFGVEANKKRCDRLEKLSAGHQSRGWHTEYMCPYAVWSENTVLTFKDQDGIGDGTASRLVESGTNTVQVQTISAVENLKNIINKHRPETLVLKMDIEGAEYTVLPELEKEGLLCSNKVSDVTLEYHYRFTGHSKDWKIPETFNCLQKSRIHLIDSEDYVKDGKPLP